MILVKTFNQKVKALKLVGNTTGIEDEEHLEHELWRLKDADPDTYQQYLNILSTIK